MIYNATKEIQEAFEAKGIKCKTVEAGITSAVEAGFSGEHIPGIMIRFISADNDNDVAVRILSFIKVPSGKRAAVLEAINSLQRQYRYTTITIDDDGDVHMSYDLPLYTENVGEVAVEAFVRMAKTVDDAYPVLMRAIWS